MYTDIIQSDLHIYCSIPIVIVRVLLLLNTEMWSMVMSNNPWYIQADYQLWSLNYNCIKIRWLYIFLNFLRINSSLIHLTLSLSSLLSSHLTLPSFFDLFNLFSNFTSQLQQFFLYPPSSPLQTSTLLFSSVKG